MVLSVDRTTALEKLTIAERYLAEAKTLDELQQIHDIAVAADAYARAHRLGLESENHAREIKFLAARRIGELVPAVPLSEAGRRAHQDNEDNTVQPSEVRMAAIPPQRLSEFRKLAEIPEAEFRERIGRVREQQEHLTYNRVLRGDWYQTSESGNWGTPQWLFDRLNEEFHFNLDVCASEDNHKCERYFTEADNGLSQKWSDVCFMNPPYGREIKQWLAKASQEARNGSMVVCLVPARPDTEWWWENCIQGEIRFIRGRLQSHKGAWPFPSAVVILGRPAKVVWWDVKARS